VSEWSGKRVLVVGLGLSGHAAARVLAELDAKVVVTEQASTPAIEERADSLRSRGVDVVTGRHQIGGVEVDVAIVSPGIPPSAPVVQELKASGVPIMGEVELAYSIARCDFLAVTGTNGKTTTTTLLAAMLERADIPSLAAGNIGLPLVDAVRSVPDGGAVAVEVSSFQLDAIETFRPKVAVVLNIAEDHTDWHGSFESYARAKERIIENQGPEDYFVYNHEDRAARHIASRATSRLVPFSADSTLTRGAWREGEAIVFDGHPLLPVDALPLAGVAGLEDALAAAAAALSYGVREDAVADAIASFKPLPHRLEQVAFHDGISYVDDSKATNPHASIAAVRGLENVALIAGGRSKGIDLTPLRETVPPVVHVVALGEARNELEETFQGLVEVTLVDDMDEAVRAARGAVSGRGSVLLSPGCASLDMYSSYAARGKDFARAVMQLIREEAGD
jgi:UDP-N-acetylmuramoylalanine--D-glutamate ligase